MSSYSPAIENPLSEREILLKLLEATQLINKNLNILGEQIELTNNNLIDIENLLEENRRVEE